MAATLHDIILGNTTIKQVRSSSISPGNRIERGYNSAAVASSAMYLVASEPRGRFQSTDIDGVLDGVEVASGLCLSNTTISFPLAGRSCGGVTAGSSHVVIGASYGYITVTSVSANQGEVATVDGEIVFLSSDGFTRPIAAATGQSLPSQTYNCQHKLGPVYIDSTLLAGVVGVTISPGLQFAVESTDGGTFPVATYLQAVEPTIDIRFRTQALLNTYSPMFASMTNATVYLRKMANGGDVVAIGTAEHISLTFATGIKDVTEIPANGRDIMEPTIRLHGHALTESTVAEIPS